MVALDWHRTYGGWHGHHFREPGDGDLYGPGGLAALVVRRTDTLWVDGDDGICRPQFDGHWWAVFVNDGRGGQFRVGHRWDSEDEAKAAAEAHVEASPASTSVRRRSS